MTVVSNKHHLKFKVYEIVPSESNFVGLLTYKKRKVGKKMKTDMLLFTIHKDMLQNENVCIGNTVVCQFYAKSTENQSDGKRWFKSNLIVQKIIVVKK